MTVYNFSDVLQSFNGMQIQEQFINGEWLLCHRSLKIIFKILVHYVINDYKIIKYYKTSLKAITIRLVSMMNIYLLKYEFACMQYGL